LLDVSLLHDLLDDLVSFNLDIIARIQDLNLVMGVNEEVLVVFFYLILIVIVRCFHLLYLDAWIVVPNLLEYVSCILPWEFTNGWSFLVFGIVLDFNYREHILDDESDSLRFIFLLGDMIDNLNLPIHIVVLAIDIFVLVGVNDQASLRILFSEISWFICINFSHVIDFEGMELSVSHVLLPCKVLIFKKQLLTVILLICIWAKQCRKLYVVLRWTFVCSEQCAQLCNLGLITKRLINVVNVFSIIIFIMIDALYRILRISV